MGGRLTERNFVCACGRVCLVVRRKWFAMLKKFYSGATLVVYIIFLKNLICFVSFVNEVSVHVISSKGLRSTKGATGRS